MKKNREDIKIEQMRVVDSDLDSTKKQYKVRVFSFCNIEDIADYHKLINSDDKIRIIGETSEFDRNGCYHIAASWMETEDSGIKVISASLLERLEYE